jgi:alginate O-acetyltransferase complex protein AlgI
MVFSSTAFLFAFLPAFLAVYYAAPRRFRTFIIAVASYVFYGWWRPDFVLLMWLSTVVDFTAGRGIVNERAKGATGKRWLLLSVCTNLGLLAYFKYANFGIDTLNAALMTADAGPVQWAEVILPVGISFYTFQTMSYTIDVYRGSARPVRSFQDFMAYVAMFPQLVAGPVVRYNTIAEQLHEREHSMARFSRGARRFMEGFAKKVLIADSVAPVVDAVFASDSPTMADAWLGTVAYTVQLYFDFSGYSDMAIGLGLMLGFTFMENFNHPYISRSITEFWQRWHISLSTWLRDYLYIPLGGNRKGPRRTYVNLALTMLLGGLWHGASWNFIAWGAWHGALLGLERRFTHRADGRRIAPNLTIPVTMVLVMIGWVIFRAPDFAGAMTMYAGMVGLNGLPLSDAISWQLTGWQLTALAIGVGVVYIAPRWGRFVEQAQAQQARTVLGVQLLAVPLFALAVLRLFAQSNTPFLYFQF